MNIMTIDKTALHKHAKLMRESPKQFSYAAAGVMNTLAFQTRTNDIRNLSSTMTIRDPRFLNNSLRVDKAKGGKNIALIESHVYSIKRDRFSGWEEQETGKTSAKSKAFMRGRQSTLYARGGNIKNRMIGGARLKPNTKFARVEDMHFKGVPDDKKVGVFLKTMVSRKRKKGNMKVGKQFLMPKYKGFKAGLYNFTKGKFVMYQQFKKVPMPKMTKWRTNSINQLNSIDMGKIWSDNVDHYVKLFAKNG